MRSQAHTLFMSGLSTPILSPDIKGHLSLYVPLCPDLSQTRDICNNDNLISHNVILVRGGSVTEDWDLPPPTVPKPLRSLGHPCQVCGSDRAFWGYCHPFGAHLRPTLWYCHPHRPAEATQPSLAIE